MAKIGYMFCGAGAQFTGMLNSLYDNIIESKSIINQMSEAFNMDLIEEGNRDDNSIRNPRLMMPLVYTMDLAVYAALRAEEVIPCMALGYSLGEWAALTALGAIKQSETPDIIIERTDAMIQATPEKAGMFVIMGQPDERVREVCDSIDGVYASNFNYSGQVTVSGTSEGLMQLERVCESKDIVYRRISVDVMSHCPAMEPAKERLDNYLKDVIYSEPICPIISNCTAEPVRYPEQLKRNSIEQLTSPVLFEKSFTRMIEEGVDTVIEVGPGRTLSGFVRKITKKNGINVTSYHVDDVQTLKETITGLRS